MKCVKSKEISGKLDIGVIKIGGRKEKTIETICLKKDKHCIKKNC